MQKRVLSLVLVLCMLLTMVPALALSVFAEDVTATVTFMYGDTVFSTQTVTGATLDFTVPDAPSGSFGWYNISPAGVIREASTFVGAAAADVTFYLLDAKSTFSPTTNWPLYTSGVIASATNGVLNGFRGGWTAGVYANDAYTPYSFIDQHTILQLPGNGNGTWYKGGIYLNEKRMITIRGSALALSYNAPATGEINIDFDALRIDRNTDGTVFSDMAMAIAVNGVIVWPQAAAGQPVKSNPVQGDVYYFPYMNQGGNTSTSYMDGAATDWAFLLLDGLELPENYMDLSDLEALDFDWTKYQGKRTGWETTLANAEAALEEAQAGGDEAAIAAAQAAVDAANAELAKWDQVKALCRDVTATAKTGDLMGNYKKFCDENGYPHGIEVLAGDRVDVVFSAVNNRHITAFPTVSYTKITDTEIIAEDTVLANNAMTDDLVFGGSNYPVTEDDTTVATGSNGSYVMKSDFGGGWSFIGYNNGAMQKEFFQSAWNTYGNWGPGILWISGGNVQRTGDAMTAENAANYGVGYAYTAKAPGTLNMDLTFNVPAANASRTVYFAIYKFPASGEKTVVYDEVGYNTSGLKNVQVEGVTVGAGDSLALVWRISDVKSHTGSSSPVYVNGTGLNFDITYTEGGCVYQSAFAPISGQNKPTYEATPGSKITYTGGWDLVSHAGLTEWTAGASINTVMEGSLSEAWLSTGQTGSIWGNKPATNTYGYSGATHAGWPANYGVIPMLNSTGGWRYTAEYDGTLTLNLRELQSRHKWGSYGYVAVFHNGEMIWPMAEGEGENFYGDINKWAVIGKYKSDVEGAAILALPVKDGSEKTGSLENIKVAYGDEIEILVHNDESCTNFWADNSCGFLCTADIAYSEKSGGIMFTTRLDENLPSAPAADQAENFVHAPVFGDPNWSFVNFPREIITKENAKTDYVAMNRSDVATDWGDGFWGYNGGSSWNYGHGENTVFRTMSNGVWGEACSVSVNNWAIGGYRYTAPEAGKIDIDVTRLFTMATTDTKTVGEGEEAVTVPVKDNAITVAIFVDCVKVWPADDSWFNLGVAGVDRTAEAVASIGDTLDNLVVGAGSTIDFLVGNPNDLSAWASRGTVFQGAITYKEQYPVAVFGSVSVEDSFTFTADAKAGIAENIEADYVTVAAKDVCNEFAYTVTGEIDGQTVTLATGFFTMQEVLMAYVSSSFDAKVSNMAVAALNYAAAAQKYFAPETADADLANAELSESQKVVAPAGEYTAAQRVETIEDAQAQLIGISLLLEEKIALKLVFDTDVEGAKVQMADNAAFDGYKEIAYTATNDGSAYKAITDGIGAANYNNLIYIRVVDAEGNVISNTIAYSVAAYCQNMKGTVGAVADAILAMYDAAAAYNA